MRVLVTGAGGQLAHDLLEAFATDDVSALARETLDVVNEAAVVAAVRDHAPDVVVHTGALTGVSACERAPEVAWRTNATGTWWVARACELSGAAMVYLSTAHVFDGRAGRPYTEFDRTNPLTMYGRTKEAGEQLVRQTLSSHYIVRTSWLVGRKGGLASLLVGHDLESAFDAAGDQRGCPTFTFDLAPAIRRVAVTGRFGTYHITNTGTCTWRELLATAFASVGRDVPEEAVDGPGGSGSPTVPTSFELENLQARLTGLAALPPWRASLDRFVNDLSDRPGPGSLG